MTTKESNVRMSEDALHTTTQLGDNLLLPYDSLIKGITMDVCFGWNTATVQASAAYLVLFDNGHLQPLPGSILGCTIATRTSTDNQNISFHRLPVVYRLQQGALQPAHRPHGR